MPGSIDPFGNWDELAGSKVGVFVKKVGPEWAGWLRGSAKS